MSHTVSLVIICPVAAVTEFNAAAQKLMHSDRELSVACSPTGEEPPTHYGLHAWVTAERAAAWTTMPAAELAAASSLGEAEINSLRAALIMSAHEPPQSTARTHFDELCAAHGLQRIVPVRIP